MQAPGIAIEPIEKQKINNNIKRANLNNNKKSPKFYLAEYSLYKLVVRFLS